MPTAALCVLFANSTLANDLPPRKPGLWEVTTIGSGARSVVKHCVGPGRDWTPQNCTRHDVTRTGQGYAVESECGSGPYVAKSKSLVTGDFETQVRSETETRTNAVPGGGKLMTVVESRRIGECQPGQSAGDIILPNGQVMRMDGAN